MSVLDSAWSLADAWPVAASSIAVVHSGGVETHGDMQRRQRIASVSKPLSAYATLISIEEGSVHLDDAVGQTGCTVRHLLAHAGGYSFDGAAPVRMPGVKRIHSKTALTDATYFGADVLDTKTLFSLAGAHALAGLQGCEQFESFGVFANSHIFNLL